MPRPLGRGVVTNVQIVDIKCTCLFVKCLNWKSVNIDGCIDGEVNPATYLDVFKVCMERGFFWRSDFCKNGVGSGENLLSFKTKKGR